MTRLKTALRGLETATRARPPEYPDLLELGSAAYLTCDDSRRLVRLRDQALEAAEGLEADQHAREALAPKAPLA